MAQPRLPDYQTLLAMNALKPEGRFKSMEAIKRLLRRMDRQQYINRFQWYNLPGDIDQELVERILYYKGQGVFFYNSTLDKFFFLPFAFSKDIDVYGRYKSVKPLPFHGKADDDKVFIPGLELKPIYSVEDLLDVTNIDEVGIIIRDYCLDYSQTVLPTKELIEPILDLEAESIPMARTNLIAHSGIKGMRVNNENDYSNVLAANKSIQDASLTGDQMVPIIGSIEYQELTENGNTACDEYLMYMQSIDNFRLSCHGLENGGLFEKKGAYVNNQAVGNIQANVGQVFNDCLYQRQKGCDAINMLFGLGVYCDASETVTNTDTNMDGQIGDQQDQNGVPGSQDNMMGVANE